MGPTENRINAKHQQLGKGNSPPLTCRSPVPPLELNPSTRGLGDRLNDPEKWVSLSWFIYSPATNSLPSWPHPNLKGISKWLEALLSTNYDA